MIWDPNQTIWVDGKYRPELDLGGDFVAVAYFQIPRGPNRGDTGGIERHVAVADARSDAPKRFKTSEEADRYCEQLNGKRRRPVTDAQ